MKTGFKPLSSVIVATTAIASAGTAAISENEETMRMCNLAAAAPRLRA